LVWCSSKFIVIVDELFLPKDPLILYNEIRKSFYYKNQHYIPTHVRTLSKSIIFATIDATILDGTMWLKVNYCIYDYKMALNCICNYDLWLLLIWMIMKMKNVVMSSNDLWHPTINENIFALQQNVSLYVKWFHWILSEFIGPNDWDLVGM
jgi:hypothetical protein